MVNYTYEKCYEDNKYKTNKKKVQSDINQYFNSRFLELKEMDITIEFHPNVFFAEYDVAITCDNIIQLNFDMFISHQISLNKYKKPLLIPYVKKNNDYLYNTLHHEFQHILNSISLKYIYDYISSIDTMEYVKVGIKNLIDEYYASISAQRNFYSPSNSTNQIKKLCMGALKYAEKNTENASTYLDLTKDLSYSIADSEVEEIKYGTNSFALLLNEEEMQSFSKIFKNIRDLIVNLTSENYMKNINDLKVNIIELLLIMNVDIDLVACCKSHTTIC